MRCDNCGEAPALKTCRFRGGAGHTFVLCDGCWLSMRERVWIVPGAVSVTGRCSECLRFVSVGELAVRRALVKEVYRGVCGGCADN